MSECIYCGSDEINDEHHLPRALGNFKGYVLLTERICKRCNQLCGLLDEQLCNSGNESFFRKYLGIKGRKSHQQINPFYRGSAGGGRIEIQGIHPHTKETIQLELTSGNVGHELRCLRLLADDDSEHVIPIHEYMTPEEFKKRFDELGIAHFKSGAVFADPDEIPWIESLTSTLKIEEKTEWTRGGGPIHYGPVDVTFTVTNRYFRAIAKIGFHYFLTKMKSFWGDEDCFAEIRSFIKRECTIDDCAKFLNWSQTQIAQELELGQKIAAWGHILCSEVDYFWITARVQLFVGPECLSPVYTIRLGRNPARIYYHQASADFFAYYPLHERGEYDGEITELRKVLT